MRKSLLTISIVCMLGVSFLLSAGKVNVTGKWEITIQSPRGERTSDIEFVQKEEKLTVIMTGRQDNKIEAEGTVKENKIEWTLTRETPRGTFTMIYKGEVKGDTMKGEVDFGSRGSMEWSAKRKKPEKK